MLRFTTFSRCAVTAAATTATTASSSAATSPGFRSLPIRSWMQQQCKNPVVDRSKLQIQFHGTKLGPQPLLFLPSLSLSSSSSSSSSSTNLESQYSQLFSKLNHQHGAFYVPYSSFSSSLKGEQEDIISSMNKAVSQRRKLAQELRGDCSVHRGIAASTQPRIDNDVSDGFVTGYCHAVVDAMDLLGVPFVTTCVAHNFGAFVAAKLALLFPERVGSLFLLGTPIVSDEAVAFAQQLREVRIAASDVNVPQELFEFSKDDLKEKNSEFVDSLASSSSSSSSEGEEKTVTEGADSKAIRSLLGGGGGSSQEEEGTELDIAAVGDVNALK